MVKSIGAEKNNNNTSYQIEYEIKDNVVNNIDSALPDYMWNNQGLQHLEKQKERKQELDACKYPPDSPGSPQNRLKIDNQQDEANQQE